jgi:hypothetical protein
VHYPHHCTHQCTHHCIHHCSHHCIRCLMIVSKPRHALSDSLSTTEVTAPTVSSPRSVSAQCLFTVCSLSLSAHCLLTVNALSSTPCLLMSAHCLFIVCSLSCSLSAHCAALSTHCPSPNGEQSRFSQYMLYQIVVEDDESLMMFIIIIIIIMMMVVMMMMTVLESGPSVLFLFVLVCISVSPSLLFSLLSLYSLRSSQTSRRGSRRNSESSQSRRDDQALIDEL